MTAFDLFGMGWTAEPSFYDEEGVEGWRWFDADGSERYTVIGLWDETPPVPYDIEAGLDTRGVQIGKGA